MNAQVIVDLPDDVLQRATRLAQLTSRKLSDVLVDALDLSLPALGYPETNAEAWTKLSDKTILALTQLEMNSDIDSRLSDLLYMQQAGPLSEVERSLPPLRSVAFSHKSRLRASARSTKISAHAGQHATYSYSEVERPTTG